MKHMKKVCGLLLALAMALSLTVTAFAGELGSITINGVSTEATYEIYKLLDLQSYDTDEGAYHYTVNDDWILFFNQTGIKAYFDTDIHGHIEWKKGEDTAAVAEFAKLALAYAKDNGIDPVKSSENAGEFVVTGTSGKFADLDLGYYLIDSTMGALCGLTTTNPDASINAKNGIPTVDKQVKEDSTNQWGGSNSADIGQTVEFRVTISVHAGAENYVLHDKMSEGLTFKSVSKIEHVVPGSDTHTVDNAKYTVKTEDLTDECTFEVHFTKEFCDELETNDKIVVYYEAMLNRNAVVADEGNPNTVKLEYGEDHYTTEDTTQTKTFGIDIIKTDSQNKLIDGAEFRIYDAATGGSEVKVVLMDDGVTYRRARSDEAGIPIVVKDGEVRVVGFDNGTYYLEETEAPNGFNKLETRQKFIISDGNLDSVFNDGIYSTGSGVHVVNRKGSMLPETGGMGTVLFVTFGTIVVLGAGVLLVTKKRMSMIR